MKRETLIIMTILMVTAPMAALAYEDVSPSDAYYMATTEDNTYILDVRSQAEWDWVGHPGANKLGDGVELEGKVINISYMIEYKGEFIINPSMLSDIQNMFPEPEEVTLITMCRSGGRSVATAMILENAGYPYIKNMLTGFEGSKDASGYRNVNGWKIDGLPYNYSGEGYHLGQHGQGNSYGLHKE